MLNNSLFRQIVAVCFGVVAALSLSLPGVSRASIKRHYGARSCLSYSKQAISKMDSDQLFSLVFKCAEEMVDLRDAPLYQRLKSQMDYISSISPDAYSWNPSGLQGVGHRPEWERLQTANDYCTKSELSSGCVSSYLNVGAMHALQGFCWCPGDPTPR